ncbi:MAG TPA: hypothetical protein VFI84_01070 [Candidatus Saccharimonadales bacterium]|nr:hypothetical protein [Candidatus Saccharimonadales bacterium]
MNLTEVIQHHLYRSIAVLVALVLIIAFAGYLARRRPKGLNEAYFRERWQEIQGLLANKNTWPLAVINADKLLDDALKKRKFKGKTMGERLVSAQRTLTSNDTVWFGHKLRNKLVHEDYNLTKKHEVKDALLGYLQALKDLGALHNRDK